MDYPSGIQLSYVRDSEGRIQQVNLTANGSTQPVVSNVRYQPFGPIASYTLGNGQTVTRSFDANDRVLSIASPAFNVQYGRDAIGNIITTSSNNAISGYLYDRLYRLTQVEDGNANPLETYTYSKAGDRKSKTANGLATGTYGYTNHWLTSTGSEARTYDAAGNTTSNQVGGNTYNYAYDNANHLVQVQANGAVMADYTYNLNNERLSKTVGDNTDRYVYNEQSQLLSETGSAHRDYLWLDDLPIGVVDNGSTVNYLIADALNTPRVITDNSGATVWYWPIESNAFGEQQPIGSFTYNLRFPGQYYDAESGLFYNVHRYYDPLTGRYVQSDPLGLLAGVNTYGYVSGNPVNLVDPFGLEQGLAYRAIYLADGGTPQTSNVGNHYYNVWIPLCAAGECTSTDAFNAMRNFSAPGASSAQDGSRDLVLPGLTSGNPINQTVDPCAKTITNVTRPGHLFGGSVNISIQQRNGVIGAQVIGTGLGPNPIMNQLMGPVIFDALGFGARESLQGSVP